MVHSLAAGGLGRFTGGVSDGGRGAGRSVAELAAEGPGAAGRGAADRSAAGFSVAPSGRGAAGF